MPVPGALLRKRYEFTTDARREVPSTIIATGYSAAHMGPDERHRGVTIRLFYDRWPQYERRLVQSIRELTPEQLALRAAPEHWPVWAIASHVAGARVYWLCHLLGEPGAETTPFADRDGAGWEDDLDHPRSADEVIGALEVTFEIVDAALDRWTPEMMGDRVERSYGDVRQIHSRTSILQRLLTHEAYHGGELAIALGSHHLDPTYIWRADDPLQS